MRNDTTLNRLDQPAIGLEQLVAFGLSAGAALLFIVPTAVQLGESSLISTVLLLALIGIGSWLGHQQAIQLPESMGKIPMTFGLLIWTASWIVAAMSRNTAGFLPLLGGFFLFALGMLMMSWNGQATWWWKAALLAALAPSFLQVTNLESAASLAAGTQFYLMFFFSLGWLLLAIQQKLSSA